MASVCAVNANVSVLGADQLAVVGLRTILAILQIWMMLKFAPGMGNAFADNVNVPRLTTLGILENIAKSAR